MAVTLHSFISDFPEDVELAIVIAGEAVTGTAGQRHAGFVVKASDGRLWLFDLAWHNVYRRSPITQEYAYIVAEFLDPFSANAVIGFLAMLHHANKGHIPYSINYENGEYFDKITGKRLKTGLGQGLTCATFVLETLSRYGFELLDKATWPMTEENKKWQEDILNKLIAHTKIPYSIDDFLAQFELVGEVPRFRPEEAIGAASYFEDQPLNFDSVSFAADEVIAELGALGLDELLEKTAT